MGEHERVDMASLLSAYPRTWPTAPRVTMPPGRVGRALGSSQLGRRQPIRQEAYDGEGRRRPPKPLSQTVTTSARHVYPMLQA